MIRLQQLEDAITQFAPDHLLVALRFAIPMTVFQFPR
jgi:hypothetical protein